MKVRSVRALSDNKGGLPTPARSPDAHSLSSRSLKLTPALSSSPPTRFFFSRPVPPSGGAQSPWPPKQGDRADWLLSPAPAPTGAVPTAYLGGGSALGEADGLGRCRGRWNPRRSGRVGCLGRCRRGSRACRRGVGRGRDRAEGYQQWTQTSVVRAPGKQQPSRDGKTETTPRKRRTPPRESQVETLPIRGTASLAPGIHGPPSLCINHVESTTIEKGNSANDWPRACDSPAADKRNSRGVLANRQQHCRSREGPREGRRFRRDPSWGVQAGSR